MGKRLGIFAFYDRDGIVDRYISYLLDSLVECLTDLVIVYNGKLSRSGRDIFVKYTDKLVSRDNQGYDIMAFREIMVNYLGWDIVSGYDEVILVNDTFFGPFCPFQDIFREMEGRKADLWGLLAHQASIFPQDNERIPIPAHIQSFFVVMTGKMLMDIRIQKYWTELDGYDWKINQAVLGHETTYTKFCEELGYRWDEFIKSDKYSFEEAELNQNKYLCIPYELLKNYNSPIVKKKVFTLINPGQTLTEEAIETFSYIRDKTSYDINMIYENILRTEDLYTLKKILHWDYVTKDVAVPNENARGKICDSMEFLIILYLHSETFLEEFIDCLVKNSGSVQKYIYVNSQNLALSAEKCCKRLEMENYRIILIEDYYNNFNHFLDICSDDILEEKKYVCFMHDFYLDGKDAFIQKSMVKNVYLNLTGGPGLQGIADLFIENERLGVLTVPDTFLLSELGMGDTITAGERGMLLNAMDAIRNLYRITLKDSQNFLKTDMLFWCRGHLLKKFAAIRDCCPANMVMDKIGGRLLPLLAQAEGYYTGTVYYKDWVFLYLENMENKLHQLLGDRGGDAGNCAWQFEGMTDFCGHYHRIYIYGAGIWGKRVLKYLESCAVSVSGFIISDNQVKNNIEGKYPVYYLSEISGIEEESGIILALGKENLKEVLPIIEAGNIKHIYTIQR